jgi:glycosyltransferase involved in cell wall biosynthesis
MKVGVFHVGTQHSWQTARAFQESGDLAWYATSIYYLPDRSPYRLARMLPGSWAGKAERLLHRRRTDLLDDRNVWPLGTWEEWLRILARRNNATRLDEWANRQNISSTSLKVAGRLRRPEVDVLWSYNTMAEEVFQVARRRGIATVLDQTIGHPAAMNRVMEHERTANPGCFISGFRRFSREQIERQDREVRLADVVVAGSDFCLETLVENGCPREKIILLPYGFDRSMVGGGAPRHVASKPGPIRFLFVGTLEPRKGVHYLLEAFRRVSPAQATLTLVGKQGIAPAELHDLPENIRHVPQVPRTEVGRFFREADCFILPSLFEGSAVVLYEALGAGLGIIQTPGAGIGAKHGENGLMIEPQSPEAIHQAVMQVVAQPQLIGQWSRRSLELAESYTWEQYHARCRVVAARAKDLMAGRMQPTC